MRRAQATRYDYDQVSQNAYTEVRYERSRGSREPTFGSACTGAAIGFLCIVGATILLWTNEGDSVHAQQSLLEARKALELPESDRHGLVHISGPIITHPVKLRDTEFMVVPPVPAMSLTRSVEVFLWQERTETHRRQVSDGEGGHVDEVRTTQHYDTIWAGKAINSDSFAHPEGHTNPSWEATLDEIEKRTNLPFRGGRFIAKATLRGEPGAEAPGGVPLELSAALRAKAETSQPATAAMMQESDAHLKRDPHRDGYVKGSHAYNAKECLAAAPRVGCARVSWKWAPAPTASVIAQADHADEQGPNLRPWPTKAGPGYEVELLQLGRRDATTMLDAAAGAATLGTWLKRGVGLLLACLGWSLLFGPATLLVSWVPLVGPALGGLAGCLLTTVAVGVGLAHALTTVAVAWLAHRPGLAVSLLAAAALSLFGGLGALWGAKTGGPRTSASASSSGAVPLWPPLPPCNHHA